MTSGSANFQETSADVGDTIYAEFTWTDAHWNNPGEFFCDMSIKDPDGNNHAYYIEENDSSGHVFLSAVTDMIGTWVAQIKVWDGSNWLTYTDTLYVSSPGAPSGTANFQETSAVVGATIHADFTWNNAVAGAGYYAVMSIVDPNGTAKDTWIEFANPTGSRTLSYTTDISGTWTAEIQVWTGLNWLTYTDTIYISPPSGDVTLTEAVTCGWVDGFENHGPTIYDFALTGTIFAYLQVHSDADLYGKVMRREWWFKEQGQTEFTKRSESEKTCTSHYTNWATWPAEDMGNQYGPGWGYVSVFVDDIFLGNTNQYSIGDPAGIIIGNILPNSEYFNGPFSPGTDNQIVAHLHFKNNGDTTGKINIHLYEYPNSPQEAFIGVYNELDVPPNTPMEKDILTYIPNDPGQAWPLGIKVWGETEPEPSW